MNGSRTRPKRLASRRRNWPPSKGPGLQTPDTRLATKEELYGFIDHLERELDDAGFFKTEDKKPGMLRNIRNLFARAALTEQEVRSLRGIVSSLTRAHERRKEGRGDERAAHSAVRFRHGRADRGPRRRARSCPARISSIPPTMPAFPMAPGKKPISSKRIVHVMGALIERVEPAYRRHCLQHGLDHRAGRSCAMPTRCPSSARCRRSSPPRRRPSPASSACWRRPAR